MTNIRSGSVRAQATAPAAPSQAPKTSQAPATAESTAQEERVKSQDDRHGAASRAFDDPQALALKSRVTGSRPDVWGFGQNLTERPLRTAPGAPPPAAWHTPGNGVLANLTVFSSSGKLEPGEAFSRLGAACVLAHAIMGGPEKAAAFINAVARNPHARTLAGTPQGELLSIGTAVGRQNVEYARLNQAQTLLARAANLTGSLKDALLNAQRPPQVNRLDKEQRDQLKLYDRMLAQRRTLDVHQATTLGALLTVALGEPSPVMRTWALDPPSPRSTRELRVRLLERGAAAPKLYEDEVVILARLGGLLLGDAESVPVPLPDEPYKFLQETVARLGASEAAVVRVHLSARQTDLEADHFITLGRRADSTAYLYNPDPRGGDYTLLFGRAGKNQAADFGREMQRYVARIRDDADNEEPTMVLLKLP